jgi:hypothetical protein
MSGVASHQGRWLAIRNTPAVLIAANGASYITTLIRQRFYYQRGLGTTTLDHIVVAISVAAVISNIAGTAVSLSWVAGRLPVRLRSASVALASALLLAAVVTRSAVSFLLLLILASYVFLIDSQRAAQNGRLIYTMLAAITAPGPTLVLWISFGTHSARNVLAGYAVGAVWQAAGAMLAARGASIKLTATAGSNWLPLVYVAAIQCDAVIDQLLLLRAGRGWAGAGTMAYSFSAACVVVFLGPLSTQALAGRFKLGGLRSVLLTGCAIGLCFEATALLALPLILRGGSVKGVEYDRLFALTLLYGMVIPVSFAWQLMSRVAHRAPSRWQDMCEQSLVIFGLHAAALVPVVVYHLWYELPVASVLGFGVGCVMIRRPFRGVAAISQPE